MRLLLSLGLVRGIAAGLVGAGVSMALTMAVRAAGGGDPWDPDRVTTVGVVVGVLSYLLGLGAFNYWLRWALGEEVEGEEEHHPRGYHWTRFFSFDHNHKVIGIQYGVTALVVLLAAGLASLVMRVELSQAGETITGLDTYNRVMSFHGIAMIAFVLISSSALINYLLPLMLGAKDMVFPRLNALSYWFVPPAVALLLAGLAAGGWDSGWTAYPPLSREGPLGQTLMYLAVYLVGFSSILGAVNFITTIVKARAPGMGFFRMPLFVWTVLASSILSLGFTQFIAMSFLMVVFERVLAMGFFSPEKGGNVILFQHLFWFYSHPAVYIMIFPWWGVISEVLPVFARKPLFAYRWMIRIAVLGVMGLSPIVWVHHLYPAGVESVLRVPQMFTTELISVPTGFFFLGWLGTLWEGRLRLRPPMLFALSFVVVFLIGGLTGIPNAEVQTDLYLHDTYWVMAHFHFTLGAIVFGLMTAIYYWFPKITGRMYDEALGRLHWALMTIGFFVTTIPMLGLGLMGMRRRIGDYDPASGFENLHMVVTIGAFIVALSVVVFLVNLVRSLLAGERAPANPWEARTLEWYTTSPPPEENFEQPPQVVGPPYPYGVPGAAHALVAPAGASNGGPPGQP